MPSTRFEDASQRLLRVVREQIRAGATSERRLAKLAGVSQPHMHNVLAGKRGLAQSVADRFLDVLGLSLEDLLLKAEPRPELALHVFDGPLGGGLTFPRMKAGTPALDFDWARSASFELPCRARVAREETSMRPTLEPGDDILLETAWRARIRLREAAVYAIEWQGRGYLCRGRISGGVLITLTEADSPSAPPPRIPLESRRIDEIVRGEVVWFGRLLRPPEG